MALPNRTAVKLRLRIEHDVEDADIDAMMASARAFLEEAVGRPITAVERTFVLDAPSCNWDGVTPARAFFLPLYPVDPDSVTIADADAVAVTAVRVNGATGRVSALASIAGFSNYPHTVTATVGLDLLPDYATRVEPKLAQAFLDLCADWYQRRNPGALAEGAGGGVITQWQTLGVPERICQQLEPYRLARAL